MNSGKERFKLIIHSYSFQSHICLWSPAASLLPIMRKTSEIILSGTSSWFPTGFSTDSKVDDFNLYRYAHDYIYPRRRNLTPYALPAGPPEEDPFINIRIIPMPWISRAKASIENDGELGYPTYYPLQLSRFAKVGQVRGFRWLRLNGVACVLLAVLEVF